MFRQYLVLLVSFMIPFHAQAGQRNYYYYTIQKNDVASDIVERANLNIDRIYGNAGSLLLLQKYNANIIPNLNYLIPGQKLYFDKSLLKTSLQLKTIRIENGNQIFFNDIDVSAKTRSVASDLVFNPAKPVRSPTPTPTPTPVVVAPVVKPQAPAIHQEPAAQVIQPVIQPILIPPLLQKTEDDQSRLVISMGTGYSRLDSKSKLNGSSATLLSKPIASIDLTWEQIWTSEYESFIGVGFATISYKEAGSGQLNDSNQSPSTMSFGMNYNVNPKSHLSFEVGAREELFVPAYQLGVATIEAKPLTFLTAAYMYDLFQVRKLKLSGTLGGSFTLGSDSGNYTISSGTAYFGRLQITQQFKKHSFFGRGEYLSSDQKTSITSQKKVEIKTEFGLIFPLGETSP